MSLMVLSAGNNIIPLKTSQKYDWLNVKSSHFIAQFGFNKGHVIVLPSKIHSSTIMPNVPLI